MLGWFFKGLEIDITTINQKITIYFQVLKLLYFSKAKFSPNPYSQHRLTYFRKLGDKNLSTISILFKEPKHATFYSRGAYSPIMTTLAIYRLNEFSLSIDWILIWPEPTVPWHMSWFLALKWGGMSSQGKRLWQTLDIGNIRANFWLENWQWFQFKE
jgi:hypothetical protein